MTDTPRRALLGALIAAPVAGAVFPSSAEAAPSDASWLHLRDRWRVACAEYDAACARRDQAERLLASIGPPLEGPRITRAEVNAALERRRLTPEGEAAEAAYRDECRVARRSRRLSEAAAMKPAQDWPSLAIKLEIAGRGAGLDVLSCDLRPQHWQRLVSEIHAVVRQHAPSVRTP